MNPFKGRHFQRDIILWAVSWYMVRKLKNRFKNFLTINFVAWNAMMACNGVTYGKKITVMVRF